MKNYSEYLLYVCVLYTRDSCYATIVEELKLEPITLDSLKKEKGFKMGKKQQKELDMMKKKYMKEKQTMQKNHCSTIDKLTKGKEYVRTNFLL